MNLEQLALLGLGIFGFMALVTCFNTVRTLKRSSKQQTLGRLRRLIASPDVALSIARSVIGEVSEKMPEELEMSRKSGSLTPTLEKALGDAKKYYLSRVEPRHRALYTQTVQTIIFGKK